MGQSPNGACYTDNPNDAVLVQGNADLKDGWVFPRVWTTEITKTAKAGDLIMSVRAPVGAMGKTAYDVVLGRGVAGIAGNEFLFQALSKKEAEGYWSTVSAGSTFDSINGDELRNTPVDYPRSKPEREAVGSCLSRIDCLITLHQCTCPIFYFCAHGSRANFASTPQGQLRVLRYPRPIPKMLVSPSSPVSGVFDTIEGARGCGSSSAIASTPSPSARKNPITSPSLCCRDSLSSP